jgi:hypothetical protein
MPEAPEFTLKGTIGAILLVFGLTIVCGLWFKLIKIIYLWV